MDSIVLSSMIEHGAMETQKKESYPQGDGQELIAAFRRWELGEFDVNALATHFYASPRVRSIVRHLAFQHKLGERSDELLQTAIARFFERDVLSTVTNIEGIFSLIYRVVMNTAMQMADEEKRWNGKYVSMSHDDPELDSIPVDDFSGKLIGQIDQDKAYDEFKRRSQKDLAMTDASKKPRNQPLNAALVKASELRPKRREKIIDGTASFRLGGDRLGMAIGNLAAETRHKRTLSKDQLKSPAKRELPPEALELKNIRERLGIRVEEFARILDIHKDRLTSMMYGRLDYVPEEIMKVARDFLKSSMREINEREEKFAQPTMNSHVQRWLGMLGLANNRQGEMELARILGVYHSTVFRWRKAEYKPDLKKIEQLEHMVKIAARQRGDTTL